MPHPYTNDQIAYILREVASGTEFNQAIAQAEVLLEEQNFKASLLSALSDPEVHKKIFEMVNA